MIQANQIQAVFHCQFPEWELDECFMKGSLQHFLKNLDFFAVENAMITACERMPDPNQTIKYFCGICWTLIRGRSAKQSSIRRVG